ncbi:MAG: tetratricopeptide repeat protein [Candidatus Eisenbacteria bacterium]|uniref:Tetratricopeptide repeat protein n=1 Tax=Eiseniibacteriota bacterium TaxID=2212470 RepID=A0A956SFM8_UNCEI|nr:tetratricopeptide repeat protein [Candidatus Eisenbacteria bacterium]
MSEGQAAQSIELVVDPWSEATHELERDRDAHPGFADVRNQLGMIYLEDGRPQDALREFQAALAKNPAYALAKFHYLVAKRIHEGVLEAEEWDAENIIQQVDEPQASLWTSWYLSQSGDVRGSVEVLDRLARTEPRFAAVAHYHRAIRSISLGDPTAVESALGQVSECHPVYRRILAERGWTGSQAGRSIASWTRALLGEWSDPQTWCPSTSPVFEVLGTRCAREGALEQARGFYEDAFLRDGAESLHQLRISRLALANGDEDEAVQALRRAIEVDPTSVEARIALGWEYQSQGYHDEALVQFEVAARLQPGYPDVQYNLGLLYEAHGRARDARTCYERALETNGKYFQARASLAQLLIGSGDFEGALGALRPLERQGIRSADLLVQKAEAHMALGELEAAIRELERAVELNPNYPRTYYILGQAYRKQGWKRKAQEAWKQHLERTRSWREQQPHLEEGEWRP